MQLQLYFHYGLLRRLEYSWWCSKSFSVLGQRCFEEMVSTVKGSQDDSNNNRRYEGIWKRRHERFEVVSEVLLNGVWNYASVMKIGFSRPERWNTFRKDLTYGSIRCSDFKDVSRIWPEWLKFRKGVIWRSFKKMPRIRCFEKMPQTTEAVSKVLTSNRLPDWRPSTGDCRLFLLYPTGILTFEEAPSSFLLFTSANKNKNHWKTNLLKCTI